MNSSNFNSFPIILFGLHAIQEVLDQPKSKAKDVHWLSYDMAIKAVIHTYSSVLVSLECEVSEHGEPTAHGLTKFMKCYKFIFSIYVLSDILPHLSRIWGIFRKQTVALPLIQPCLKDTLDWVKQYKEMSGPNLRKLDEVISSE